MATDIYRKDFNYVKILPKAIVAAQNIYSNDAYITEIDTYADAIIANTTTKEWAARYFAAQVYLDLYAKTNDRGYLEDAYKIAYDNVVVLLDEQMAINSTYLAKVTNVTWESSDYLYKNKDENKTAENKFKAEQKLLDDYNKALEKARESELPTLYEPLLLNCDLLFALAEKMNISSSEQSEIETILQTEKNGVFLTNPINYKYSFTKSTHAYSIELNKDNVIIPVVLLATDSDVTITVSDSGETTTFDDCVVSKVERKGTTIESFYATISGKKMKDYKWSENSQASVIVKNGSDNILTFRFKVVEYKDNWILPDKVVFEEQ